MDDMMAIIDAQVEAMFRLVRQQFGPAVQGYWMNEEPGCPGCGGEVDAARMGGRNGISVNVYFYRPRGLLIGYLLCGRCAEIIHRSAARMPGRQIALHTAIERTLEEAYLRREDGARRRRAAGA